MNGSEYNELTLMPWTILLVILLAGFGLGLLFYGSLWLSTNRILQSRHPLPLVVAGFILRMALILSAVYWLTDVHWQKLLAVLGGFIMAQLLAIRLSAR